MWKDKQIMEYNLYHSLIDSPVSYVSVSINYHDIRP